MELDLEARTKSKPKRKATIQRGPILIAGSFPFLHKALNQNIFIYIRNSWFWQFNWIKPNETGPKSARFRSCQSTVTDYKATGKSLRQDG